METLEKYINESLMDSISDYIFVQNTKGKYIACNQAFANFLAKSKEEIIGKYPCDFFDQSSSETLQNIHTAFLKNPSNFQCQLTVNSVKTGQCVYLKGTKELKKDAHEIVTVLHDTTSEQLYCENQLSKQILATIKDGVLITNCENKIVYVNEAFSALTGYYLHEVFGKNPNMLRSNRSTPTFYKKMWDSIASNDCWQGEIWNLHKNGEIKPHWMSINVLRGEDNTIHNYVAVFSDISDIKRTQKNLEFMAHHDTLTQLANRSLLEIEFNSKLQRAIRNKTNMALIFMDLDSFKEVNDHYGHHVGDYVLKVVAQRLLRCVRRTDTVARLGGDEFILLIEDVEEIDEYANRVIDLFQESINFEKLQFKVTTSMGISQYPKDGKDLETLLQRADKALYEVKISGRNGFKYYSVKNQ